MKTTDPVEKLGGAAQHEGEPSPRKSAAGRKGSTGSIPHLPMEWMDPMSWRLPSGKALAEFALQTGFLAPLILSGPRMKKKKTAVERHAGETGGDLDADGEEAPERSGTFRGKR